MYERHILYYFTLLCLASHIEPNNHTESKNDTKPDIDVRQMLKEEGIIPDVIQDCPNKLCTVIYRGKSIEPGDYLYDSRTPLEPKVIWETKNDTFYTLYMSGSSITRPKYPMPTRPDKSRELVEWENWVVVNIPGCEVEKGDVLADYLSPRLEGDKERFLFLIYEQPRNYSFRALKVKNELEFPDSFKVMDFAKLHNLIGPVAVNYFITDSLTIPAPV